LSWRYVRQDKERRAGTAAAAEMSTLWLCGSCGGRMNDQYIPYQKNGAWYFDNKLGRQCGPYIAEEQCERAADKAREKDEE